MRYIFFLPRSVTVQKLQDITVVLTLTDKIAYTPTRFEDVVEARKSIVHEVDDGKTLEFASQANAQAMTINVLATIAAKH